MADTATAIAQLLASVPDVERLVFWVGAGLSLKSGYDLWPAAASKVLDAAKQRGLSDGAYLYATEKLAGGDLYGVFQIIKDSFPAAAYRSIVLEVFEHPNVANDTQKLLVGVSARGLITTNFDECLTAAQVEVNKETALSSIREILASRSYFIAQPHGTIRDFDSMVLCKSDWERVVREGQLRQLLEQVVSQNQLVILGYGMSDPDFQHIWTDLLSERIFAETALLCCTTGTLLPSKVAEYRQRNVQVVEFDDPAGKYGYIDELLKALSERTATNNTHPASAVAQKIGGLEQYVMLCIEFSPKASRLSLVCRAIILEQLMKFEGGIAESDLIANSLRTLGESSATTSSAARDALSSLVADAKVVLTETGLVLTQKAKTTLDQQVKTMDTEEERVLRQIVKEHKPLRAANDLSIDVLKSLVDEVFAAFGMEVAEFFLYARPARIPNEKVETLANEFCASRGIDYSLRPAYAEAVKSLIIQPEESYAPVVFRKLQSYFITSAFILSPTSEKLVAEYAEGHLVYLDASIILPSIALGHSSQPLYRSMLSSTLRLGMKLRVSRAMLNEVVVNLRTAQSAFRRFGRSNVDMSDILSGYITLQGKSNGNVFIEGYQAELELDPQLTPEAYIRSVLGGDNVTEQSVLKLLAERYAIELDVGTEDELDKAEVSRLTDAVAHLRKMGNRFKTELLCRHEAVQFALIHKRRFENADLAAKIWFITTDFFIVELQRLEIDRYPLPISYTPRLWFQYLNLLDHEARGSKHYARLQQRMRYGVAVGGMGLTAIFQILEEKQSLIKRGVASVQEIAEAIVNEYHVQHSIDTYTFSPRPEGNQEALAVLARNMKRAVQKVETIKTREVDQLRTDKDEAIKRAVKAEKALAKEKYIRRTANRTAKASKKKRR